MNLDKFVVVFDSPTDSYYAGQNVTGQVQLLLMSPKKIRSLQIQFVGKGEVKWSELVQNEGRTKSENVVYSADEEYYTYKYNLAGGGNSELHLPPGQHNFSFAACLPPALPASFEGDRGYVRYSVTATLERPWNSNEYATAIFTVISPIDLNYNPLAKAPVHMEVEKSFCCCWCRSGPLQMVLAIPHSGWVPGQAIPLTLEIDNASNVTVSNLIIKLEKVLDWKARNPQPNQRRDQVELSKLTLPGVESGGSKSWSQLLPIPSVATFNLDQCTIINCSYKLTAKAVVGGCHINLTMEVPVFLGTVPVYEAAPTDAPSAPPPPANASIGFNPDASQWCYPSMTTPLLPTQNGFWAAQ